MNSRVTYSLEDVLRNSAKYYLLSYGQDEYLNFLKEFNMNRTNIPFTLDELEDCKISVNLLIKIVEKEYRKRGIPVSDKKG